MICYGCSVTGSRKYPAVVNPMVHADSIYPTEIELEFTNKCNAACVACPRDAMPAAGRMTRSTLEHILDLYDRVRSHHPLRLGGFPRVTVAGGGDPLMHREAVPFLARCVDRDFPTLLITNASALTPSRTDELLAAGLSEISVSFWGIQRDEYEAAMKLPYERTLANVVQLAKGAREADIPFAISWVRVPELSSTDEEIREFWCSRGIDVSMSDNAMWNRAGLLSIPRGFIDIEVVRPPDIARDVWCADLKYTDAWTWDGRLVLCCCNFFMERQYQVGDLTSDWREISDAKRRILDARPIPAMCQSCLQPRRNQAEWLAAPWRNVLSDAEWRDVTYQD